MKRKEVIQHLENNGCRQIKRRGASPIWTDSKDTRRTSLPRRPNLNPEEIIKICRQLGISVPDTLLIKDEASD